MFVIKKNTASLLAGILLLVFFIFPSVCFSAENTIGVIMTGDIPYYQELHQAFMARLGREGISARTAVIVQKPYPDAISLSNAARKLIATDVDIIVAYGTPAVLSVVNERTTIPMVYAAAYEPYMSQIKARNSTGITTKLSLSSLLRYLKGLTQISTLGVVYSGNEEDSLFQFREISKLAGQQGIRVNGVDLKRHQEAKAKLSGLKADAILITGSSVGHLAMPAIREFAREHKIPVGSFLLCREFHAVVTLATNPVEQGEKAADKVIKILGGVSPEKIRVENAHDVELVFNFKEAVSMGWKMPMDLVTEATRLIK
jgi:ABC-type uncharacterized transport system substrate-binding protein